MSKRIFCFALGIDLFHLEESEVSLVPFGSPDLTGNGVARPKRETTYLGGRNVDVIGPRQVVGIRGTQKPVSVREDLQNPLSGNNDLLIGLRLQYGEDELLFLEPRRTVDMEAFRDLREIPDTHRFQFFQIHTRSPTIFELVGFPDAP